VGELPEKWGIPDVLPGNLAMAADTPAQADILAVHQRPEAGSHPAAVHIPGADTPRGHNPAGPRTLEVGRLLAGTPEDSLAAGKRLQAADTPVDSLAADTRRDNLEARNPDNPAEHHKQEGKHNLAAVGNNQADTDIQRADKGTDIRVAPDMVTAECLVADGYLTPESHSHDQADSGWEAEPQRSECCRFLLEKDRLLAEQANQRQLPSVTSQTKATMMTLQVTPIPISSNGYSY
jgi:hypothetical protein